MAKPAKLVSKEILASFTARQIFMKVQRMDLCRASLRIMLISKWIAQKQTSSLIYFDDLMQFTQHLLSSEQSHLARLMDRLLSPFFYLHERLPEFVTLDLFSGTVIQSSRCFLFFSGICIFSNDFNKIGACLYLCVGFSNPIASIIDHNWPVLSSIIALTQLEDLVVS